MNAVQDLIAADINSWIHPVVSPHTHEVRGPSIWAGADRVHLVEPSGRKVLDGFSGLWCVNAGYGHESIAKAAYDQLQNLPYATGYFHFSNEASIRLAERLVALTPSKLTKVIFGQGGSDAVDTAIRVIRYFFNVQGKPHKKHIIALERGYHGTSVAGAGLTALTLFQTHFDSLAGYQHHIPSHYPYRNDAVTDREIIAKSVKALEEKVEELGCDLVAAFICEPIQGSGGVIVPPVGYLTAMQAACLRLGILFVVDEVITGFGRTGALFGCDHEQINPDIMTMAKGLTSGYAPMSATLISSEIYETIKSAYTDGTPFGHGQTYAGHPVSAAIANAALDLYLEGGLVENGKQVGNYFITRLKELEALPFVGEVRGQGMLAAVELVTNKASKQKPAPSLKLGQAVLNNAFKKGLVFRAFGDDILGFAPSLNYTTDDVDTLIDILRSSLTEVVPKQL